MGWKKYSLSLLFLSSCLPAGFPTRDLESNAHITFLLNGQKVVISDSAGGEAMPPSMYARYNQGDSTYFLTGSTYGGPAITFNLLSTFRTGPVQLNGFSTASVANYNLTRVWRTDSVHTGLINIDSTMQGTFSGTFNFVAIDSSDGSTIRVDSGVISGMGCPRY